MSIFIRSALLAVIFLQYSLAVQCQEKLKCVIYPIETSNQSGDDVWLGNIVNKSLLPRILESLASGYEIEPISGEALPPPIKADLEKRRKYAVVKLHRAYSSMGTSFNDTQPIVLIDFDLELEGGTVKKAFTAMAYTRQQVSFGDENQAHKAIKQEMDYLVDDLLRSSCKNIVTNINELYSERNPNQKRPAVVPAATIASVKESKPKSNPDKETVKTGSVETERIRDKWALIVGISEFEDKRIPRLKYSAKDARDFRDFLVKECNFAPDHVRLLLNEKATERRVSSELGNRFLARVAKPSDLTVLYFSTHGSSSKSDIKGKNYLVAYDTDRDDLYATGIEMQKITDAISERVDSGRVLLVLDACHSGATDGAAKAMSNPSNFDAEELAQGSGKLVMCSSKPEQQSFESTRYQNGVFTRKLIEGLRIKGQKTKLGEAFTFVESAVKYEVQEDHAIKQEPVLRSKWDGTDLMIAVPPSSPQALPESVKSILQPDSSVQAAPVSKKSVPVERPARQ